MSRSSRAAVLYAALGAVHVAAAAVHRERVQGATKPLLMPALALYATAAHRERGARVSRRLLLSLSLACAGDVALRVRTTTGLTIGMAFFFAAYVIFTAEFIRTYAAGPRPRRWVTRLVAVGYGTAVPAVMAWLWQGLRDRGVALPMAGYAGLMALMASTAPAWGWPTGLGAGLLLASDALIGVDVSGTAQLPGHRALVMSTYLMGLALVVNGWTARAPHAAAPTSAFSALDPVTA